MKDKNRIGPMIYLLTDAWSKHPDLRLGQLISTAASLAGHDDPFYLKDEELEMVLKEMLESKSEQ